MSSHGSAGAGSKSSKRPPAAKKKPISENGSLRKTKSSGGERTVKKLRLSKALTIPDGTTVADACRRMVTRRVDAALLTDSTAMLCGIITDKDVATRVIAENLRPDETLVSKVMTKNPVFVMSDALAVDALQKMVQGKFRHLPVVENGEVIALLDITKCLYDAIARMEKAAEKGNAIAAAVQDVERQWGNTLNSSSTFIDTLRERMFRPTLSTLINENTKVATVSPSDTVLTATRKMREFRVNSVIITINNKPQGILTSKDVLMRVVASNLAPDSTTVDKVMTPNPECVTLETTIVDALHTMHDGKFLHLPVVDQENCIVACLDVLQLTHGAVATVGNVGGGTPSETGSTMMQKFWDSAFALDAPEDDDDTQSNLSATLTSEAFHTEVGRLGYPSGGPGNVFGFKLKDRNGRVHRFNCGTESLTELVSAVVQRLGDDIDRNKPPQILYEDDERDRVLLSSDGDLVAAVNFAKATGLKGLKLHVDYPDERANATTPRNLERILEGSPSQQMKLETVWSGNHTATAAILACSAAVVGVGLIVYLRRSS
ncbi:hypothetical protein SELMODRAFT_149040 [Selaginella moellendorffii]|uniref:CBS domain-containing protein n=1 Tax=Selaginella moellendorffii TaxID=88036 RepID=D8RQF3_SELML|nr:CBS domain-containing protein CBSCBSPB3 [Selaginella moellendorffii]EFJ25849.1 hypothetical protein SELMODRAFT_149040 [Selaginella moellendorffii]|eukprot:XP_002973475.1 CBS domain-containing protein CBSCBSPB3 [Selaginella moellendorffii]